MYFITQDRFRRVFGDRQFQLAELQELFRMPKPFLFSMSLGKHATHFRKEEKQAEPQQDENSWPAGGQLFDDMNNDFHETSPVLI
jgi:hypothetical protein